MSIRLYFDEDCSNGAVVAHLRSNGFDCLTVSEAARTAAPDESQLEFAAAAQRSVVTANTADFCRLHTAWLVAGRSHAGIIVITDQKADVGTQIRAFQRIADQFDAAELRDQLIFLLNWA